MGDDVDVLAHSFESPACPNRCGNGVSRSVEHPTWHCWRCRVDAVMVEYVTFRADDWRGAVEAIAEAYECLTDADTLGPDVTETAVEAARMVLAAELAKSGPATDEIDHPTEET